MIKITEKILGMIWDNPRFCSRCRREAQKTVAKRAVGAILQR